MELAQEYANKYPEMVVYLEDLKSIITQEIGSDVFEGNCFYHHNSLREFSELYTKQLNLFWCGKPATRICEIGFNAGHSSMLLLLGRNRDPLNFTIFDIGHHRYTAPCLNYIRQAFLHVQFEYVEGDSTITMPEWINARPDMKEAYDLVHVDGGHSEYCASNDMKNADILLKIGGTMIIDDTDAPQINNKVNIYVASGRYVEINVLKTFGYPHRIIQKIE
jgi:predicted O-methyltransferase YrrM